MLGDQIGVVSLWSSDKKIPMLDLKEVFSGEGTFLKNILQECFLFVYLSIYLFIFLFFYFIIFPSIYSFICLSICLFIYFNIWTWIWIWIWNLNSISGSATDIAWTLRDSISSGPPCLAFAVGSLDGTVLFVQLGEKSGMEGRRGEERRGEETIV